MSARAFGLIPESRRRHPGFFVWFVETLTNDYSRSEATHSTRILRNPRSHGKYSMSSRIVNLFLMRVQLRENSKTEKLDEVVGMIPPHYHIYGV